LHNCYEYGQDTTLFAWDVATGAAARGLPRLPAGVRVLSYSADAREGLLLQREEMIVRWDVDKGKELGRYPRPERSITAVGRVGERLLVPQFDGRVVGMWDAAQKKRLWSVAAAHEKNSPDLRMAFSEDGKLFAIEAPPRAISVLDSVTGKTVCRLEGDAARAC